MITRDFLTRFEAIVRRHLPKAAVGAAIIGAAACTPGPGDPDYRPDPSYETGIDRVFVPVDEAKYEALMKAFEAGEPISMAVCAELCTGSHGSLVGCTPTEDGQEKGVACDVEVRYMHPVGRKPPGMDENASSKASAGAGQWFADCARMEEAAVFAFVGLLNELTHHGAPEALRSACLAAITDEIQHTHMTRDVALSMGATPTRPAPPMLAVRPLLDIALDNAVEGCIRETYSALQATWQAHMAPEGPARDALAQIASDETRHAELSWSMDDWLQSQLAPEERAQVVAARQAAISKLKHQLESAPEKAPEGLGMPQPEQAAMLLAEMVSERGLGLAF